MVLDKTSWNMRTPPLHTVFFLFQGGKSGFTGKNFSSFEMEGVKIFPLLRGLKENLENEMAPFAR